MDIEIERLTECIGRAVYQAEFTNVLTQRFDSSVTHEPYAPQHKERVQPVCHSRREYAPLGL